LANRKQKSKDEQVEKPDVDAPDATGDAVKAGEATSAPAGSGVPRWRQIEVMHERAQLRKMLDDLDMDFDELEMEVFGSEAEHDLLYRHIGDEEDTDEDEELDETDEGDDEDFEDDEFEDLEE
jgi:hypothetical protein